MARPYLSLLNKWIKLASKKYNALKPNMANIFEV